MSTDLIADLFRKSQAEESLKNNKPGITGVANEIISTNYSISNSEREHIEQLKRSPKKLMLDE